MKYFLFLEFKDSHIEAFLSRLREIFGEERHTSRIHITVRGPYSSAISPKKIKDWKTQLGDQGIVIQGTGRFKNKKECVVYLKIQCKNLKKIWYKPEYPEYNPHISIYRGSDQKLADDIYEFLKRVNIKLICNDYELTTFVHKQELIFKHSDVITNDFSRLLNWGKVDENVIQNAIDLVKNRKQLNLL